MTTSNNETVDPNISTNIDNSSKRYFPMRVVVNTYNRQMDDELDLRPGDKIHVITDDEQYNDGWYFGKNLNTGKMGLFPSNFTQVVDNKESIMNKKSHRRNSSLIITNQNNLKLMNNDSFNFQGNNNNNNNNKSMSNYNSNLKSEFVVNSTMNDIDQALRALKNDSMDILGDLSSISTGNSGTITSLTNTSFPNDNNTFKSPLNVKPTKGPLSFPISGLEIPYDHITDLNLPQKDYTFDIHDLNKWSPDKISSYFIKRGIDNKTASLFVKHKINGSILLELELLHLKELDIDSFGTRFTIFKIIEDLKRQFKKVYNQNPLDTNSFKSQLSVSTMDSNNNTTTTTTTTTTHNNDSLLPAASVPSVNNNIMLRERLSSNHQIDTPISHNRIPSGISVNNQTLKLTSEKLAGLAISSNEHLFDSPGIAPKPPSYPSPVQPRLSPLVNKNVNRSPSFNRYSFPREKYENKNRPSTKLENNYLRVNHDYRFGSLPRSMDLNNISENESLNTSSNSFKIRSSSKNITKSTFDVPSTNSPISSSITPFSTTATEINNNFRSPKLNTHGDQTTPIKNRVSSNHKKSVSGGSFIDLFNRISSMSPSRADLLEDNESTVVPERPSSVMYSHSRSSSGVPYHMRKSSQGLLDVKKHRRTSSVLSFLSPNKMEGTQEVNSHNYRTVSHSRNPSVINSPLKQEIKENIGSDVNSTPKGKQYRHSMFVGHSVATSILATMTPKKQALTSPSKLSNSTGKMSKNDISTSSKTRQLLRFNVNDKKKTSAFTEGIRNITVEEAIKDASCYGWMYKKSSGTMGTWKKRFFVLHGTRLSYFTSLNDTRERGLIDITSHRVVPIKDDDKLIAFSATSTRSGKYIFKLLPPQPGSRKGLTFTQPKVHYFSVDSKEDIKNWLSALIKASIDIDDTVPVISTYAMPTISLNEAKQMLKEAKEEMALRIQDDLDNEKNEGRDIWEQKHESLGRLSSNVL